MTAIFGDPAIWRILNYKTGTKIKSNVILILDLGSVEANPVISIEIRFAIFMSAIFDFKLT